MTKFWTSGEVIVRREVIGLQPDQVAEPVPEGRSWLSVPVFVVDDGPERLASYIAPGAQFGFHEGPWPTPDGRHPWSGRSGWEGNGCLMVQTPGEHHAVWHFWDGPERRFMYWYVNLQTAFVRRPAGYDTQDLELDLLVFPDGSHEVKDAEVLDDRVTEGRYSAELVAWIRTYGDGLIRRLETEGPWWDQSWAAWTPDPTWSDPQLPDTWSDPQLPDTWSDPQLPYPSHGEP